MNSAGLMVEPALNVAAQVTVGNDADEMTVLIGHPDDAEPLSDISTTAACIELSSRCTQSNSPKTQRFA